MVDWTKWQELFRKGPRSPLPSMQAPRQSNSVRAEAVKELIGALDEPVIALSTRGRVLTFSPLCTELFPGIAKGRPIYQISRNPELLDAIQDATANNVSRTINISEPALRGRRMRISISPVGAQAGPGANTASSTAFFLLVQARDLSEEDRLAQMRSDFIANASHELRTPLSSIKGFIETLQGPASKDTSARSRFLGIMDAQASRMMRILDDLLSLSRIEMRAHLPPEGVVDLAEIVSEVVHGLEPLARERQITLAFQVPDEKVLVSGDGDELTQVFQNLIQNAIKYGNEAGTVEVTIEQTTENSGESGNVVVTVKDDGPGIGHEHLPRLTERFYRVDSAVSRERGGTGLGLAIVKHVLNRHRGELEIKSTVGIGSIFTVRLPTPSVDKTN